MATTIITKNGSGAPLAGDLQVGELAIDLTNKKLYSKEGTTVFEVGATGGGAAGTFTDLTATNSFTSVGIDDNATSTAITIDSSQNVSLSGDLTVDTNTLYVDSTNNRVGIGTSIPDGKLNVVKGTASGTTASTSANNIVIDGTSGTETGITLFSTVASGIRFGDASGASQGVIEYGHATNYMRFVTNAAERMRIDSSGNVGIGTSSPFGELSIKSASPQVYLETVANGNVQINFNETADQLDVMVNNSNGKIAFGTNSTERMRIDSSGNVTIDGSDASTSLASTAILNLKAGDANNEYSILRFATSADGSIAYIGAKATTTGAYPSSVGNLEFGVQNGASTVTAMTINNSGNVGIGTTNPVRQLSIEKNGTALASLVNTAGGSCQLLFGDSASDTQGRVLYDNNGDYLTLYANGAERMRIDSSGNLLVGTTVTPAYGVMNLKNPADAARWQVGPNEFGNFVVYNQSTVGVYLTDGGTSWTGTSDERLKENINDIGPVLETIKNYQCVNFSYKANQSKKANSIGFIAQDWENDFPNVIETDDNDYLGIKYTETIPVLLRAIQEQQAMIETLQAQVAELQGA